MGFVLGLYYFFVILPQMKKGKSDISIRHPEVWELLVSVDETQVDYALYTPTVANSLTLGRVELPDASLQALEDAIYDTPMLLGEYKRVRVVAHSRHFLLLPMDAADDDCAMLVRQAFPDDDGDTAVCPMPANGVKIAYLLPRGMQAFLGRTFNYPAISHPLMPLCEYFKDQGKDDDASRMFLHLCGGSMDMAIYRNGELQCANIYPFTNAQDAAFFALSAWRAHGLDQLTDQLLFMGDGDLCAQVTPDLREYVKHVMPAVFPTAAMQLGHNAMQAPLDLILLALCE